MYLRRVHPPPAYLSSLRVDRRLRCGRCCPNCRGKKKKMPTLFFEVKRENCHRFTDATLRGLSPFSLWRLGHWGECFCPSLQSLDLGFFFFENILLTQRNKTNLVAARIGGTQKCNKKSISKAAEEQGSHSGRAALSR